MALPKKYVDLVWINRDPIAESRLITFIEGISIVDELTVEGAAETICSIRVQVDNDEEITPSLAQHIKRIPGFDVEIQSVSTESHAEAVIFSAINTVPIPIPETPQLSDLESSITDNASDESSPDEGVPAAIADAETPGATESSTDETPPSETPTPKPPWEPSEPLATSLKWTGSSTKTKTLVFIGVAFNILILISLFTGWLNLMSNDTHRRNQGVDFFSIYQGSANLFQGRSVYQDSGFEPDVPYAQAYRYMPSVTYTFAAPFLLLDPWNAYWIWVAILELILVFNIILTRQVAKTPNQANITTAMWLLFTPLYSELYMGQFSFVMGSMFLWMMLGTWKIQPRMTQLSWIGSVLLKTNSLLFAPAFLRTGNFRILVLAAIAIALLNMPYFAMNDGDASTLLERNSGTGTPVYTTTFDAGGLGVQALASIVGHSLEGHFEAGPAARTELGSLSGQAAGWRFPLLWLLGPATIFGALVATFLVRKFDLLLNVTIWISVYLIVFKDVWEHHYLMLLPMLILLFARGKNGSTAALIVWVLLALPTAHMFIEWWIIIAEPSGIVREATFDPQVYWPPGISILYHTTKAVPVVVFFLFLLRNSFSTGHVIPFRQYSQRGYSIAGHLWQLLNERLPVELTLARASRYVAKLAPSD